MPACLLARLLPLTSLGPGTLLLLAPSFLPSLSLDRLALLSCCAPSPGTVSGAVSGLSRDVVRWLWDGLPEEGRLANDPAAGWSVLAGGRAGAAVAGLLTAASLGRASAADAGRCLR